MNILIRKIFTVLILASIILLAAFLRLYRLGEISPSLDWDEASLGWNAYSILKTGTDEYGKAWPVSIRSFNDYKPPLYVYAAVPSIAIFGLNEFAVRFPSALAGILTVLLTFFLVKELTRNRLLSYCVTALLAISPWSIQFSRGAFEANFALFFFVLGAYLLLKFPLLSVFPFALSIYSYHSPRLVIPVFLFLYFILNFKTLILKWKSLILYSIVFILLLYPLARNTFHVGSVTARLNSVKLVSSPGEFINNYFSHYNFDFLFLNADGNPRHHIPDFGLLYLIEAPFLITGFYYLVKNRPSWLPFLVSWLIAAPVASSIVIDAPHAIRSLLFLPTFQIITAYGLINLSKRKLLVFGFLILVFGNFLWYFHQYFVHFPIESASGWQYGYKQAVKKVLALENKYDRIYVTSAYDQPYIYFLFYGRISPVVKNSGYFYKGLDKYEFSLEKIDSKGLYIIAPTDKVPGFQSFDTINFPDGTPAFLFGTIAKS
ncbi:MAG: phospholipid carrier-dependent glycosyltransferase [Patescibacteria group bacterium]